MLLTPVAVVTGAVIVSSFVIVIGASGGVGPGGTA